MNRTPALAFLAIGLLAAGCHLTSDDPADAGTPAQDGGAKTDGADAAADAGASHSIACYIAGQFRCKEFPDATSDQLANLPVECSSTSGQLTQDPADCPKAGFVGKCTMGSGKGREVKRVYQGADAAYEQDFCINTANGVWSTTF